MDRWDYGRWVPASVPPYGAVIVGVLVEGLVFGIVQGLAVDPPGVAASAFRPVVVNVSGIKTPGSCRSLLGF